MNHIRALLILLISIFTLTACDDFKEVTVERLYPLQSSSSFHHLIYIGSDNHYHYFIHRDKLTEKLKIKRNEENPYTGAFELRRKEPKVVLPGSLENRQLYVIVEQKDSNDKECI